LSNIWDTLCLETIVSLVAGALYFVQRKAKVPNELPIDGYGTLARLASNEEFFAKR